MGQVSTVERTNWSQMGRFSPLALLKLAMPADVALAPRTARASPPGMRWMRMNMKATTPMITATAWRSRRTRKPVTDRC